MSTPKTPKKRRKLEETNLVVIREVPTSEVRNEPPPEDLRVSSQVTATAVAGSPQEVLVVGDKPRGISSITIRDGNRHFLTAEASKYLSTPIRSSEGCGFTTTLSDFVRYNVLYQTWEALRAGDRLDKSGCLTLDDVKLFVGTEGAPQVCRMCAIKHSKQHNLPRDHVLPTAVLEKFKIQPVWWVRLDLPTRTAEKRFWGIVSNHGVLSTLAQYGLDCYTVQGSFFVNGDKQLAVCGSPTYYDRSRERYLNSSQCLSKAMYLSHRWTSALTRSHESFIALAHGLIEAQRQVLETQVREQRAARAKLNRDAVDELMAELDLAAA